MADMPPQLAPFAFDSVKAALAGQRSGQARRNRSARMSPPTLPAFSAQEVPANPHARKIERLESQLDQLDDLLDEAKTAAEWRDLTNARARLFDQWAQLSGIPKAGSRRPGKEPSKRQVWGTAPEPVDSRSFEESPAPPAVPPAPDPGSG